MTINSETVLISTEAATAPLVLSHMCVEGVALRHTHHRTAHKGDNINKVQQWQLQQLQEETYVPQTPLNRRQLAELLQHHPDSDAVTYVLLGLKNGFSLEYQGEFKFRTPKNLPTAQLNPKLIRDKKLFKEISLKRMLGPFDTPPFPDLMCSPVGLVPKKDSQDMRMIMHLSYPYGESINDYIDPEKAATQYQQFDDAVLLVVQQGRFCWLAKGDVKSAFRVAPVCFRHIRCLGIKFDNQYFIDITLPFGSAISCAIFEEVATLIHWIFKQRTAIRFVHYLDDYLWVHRQFIMCMSACHAVQQVAGEVGLPLTPEKFVWPTQKLEFLGLTINTVRMAVAIPQDKREAILREIENLLQVQKCKVKQVQALAGRLNFVTRAVPHSHPFSRRLYHMIAGMRPHRHVSITNEVKRDLVMWKCFIQEYGGGPPCSPQKPQSYTCSPMLQPQNNSDGGHGGT